MMHDVFFWTFVNLLAIAVSAFYSMAEMACVSLNKVRLHYYVSKGNTRAKLLQYLLEHSSRLFGTTLIGVNIANVYSAECGRRTYEALGLPPDLAPLTQVFLVVIFGELAPMFAARNYSEHVAMLGAPILYASARVLAPVIWLLSVIQEGINRIFFSTKETANLYITQEELQKMVDEHHEELPNASETEEFNTVTARIFKLAHSEIGEVMIPMQDIPKIPSNATVAHARQLLRSKPVEFLPIYNRSPNNIVGIAYPRDLVRISDTKRVRDYSRDAWFVTERATMMQILEQFRVNNQTVAVILDSQGACRGILTLNDLIEIIFGKAPFSNKEDVKHLRKHRLLLIEKTFDGSMQVKEFNRLYHMKLSDHENLTLSQLMIETLDHHPVPGESVTIGHFELTAKETSLLGVKTVLIKTNL